MRLPKFSGKLKKPKLLVRRVVGSSMSPKLAPGQLVIATGIFGSIHPGEVYIFEHGGREMIKRVERTDADKIFFVGDNMEFSSDSRQFGWVDSSYVSGKVIWPRIHN